MGDPGQQGSALQPLLSQTVRSGGAGLGAAVGGGFLICAGLAFATANAVILARGAARWADSGWEKVMYGGVAGTVPFIIAIAPVAIWLAWKLKRRAWAVAGSFMYVVFVLYNLLGASGAIAIVRTDAVSARLHDVARATDRTTQRAALVKQRDEIPANIRPPAMVEGLLAAEKVKPQWGFSDECRELHNNQVRKFCAGYAKLRAELGAGRTRERLNEQIAALDKQSGDAGWVSHVVDPQSDTIAAGLTALGFKVKSEHVQPLLPLATPFALEIGALVLVGLGFVVLGIHETALLTRGQVASQSPGSAGQPGGGGSGPVSVSSPPSPPQAKPSKPDPMMQRELLEWFFRECTRPVASAILAEDAWYAAYSKICVQSQGVPLPLSDFRTMAEGKGISTRKVHGVTYYENMLPLTPKESAA